MKSISIAVQNGTTTKGFKPSGSFLSVRHTSSNHQSRSLREETGGYYTQSLIGGNFVA